VLVGIDHLVIAVEDPDSAVAHLASALGCDAGGGGRHDSLGTHNRLIWLGDTYVELIGVFDRHVAAESWLGRPTLATLERGGGLATWAVATDEIVADVTTLRRAGSPIGLASVGERTRPDGRVVRWQLATPATLDVDRPFLIEHDTAGAEWTPAERAARRQTTGRLRGISVHVADPGRSAGAINETIGLEFDGSDSTRLAAIAGTHTIRVGPRSTGGDRATIDVAFVDRRRQEFSLHGCRWRIEAISPFQSGTIAN
jgi:hypothetical protein